MRYIIATLLVSLSVGTLLPAAVVAQPAGKAEEVMPLAPPPGPYISSRPNLDVNNMPSQEGNRMPFIGTMPPPPMRYMPSPRQMSVPPQWWYGPMGR